MKAVIFHGTGMSPDSCWYGWLKQELTTAGYTVSLPHYPAINDEPIETFLPKVLAAHSFEEDMVLIGHSAGVPLILSILENVEVQFKKIVLVAGFVEPQPTFPSVVLQKRYDWERIKQHAQEFVIVNSDNDPWACDDKQGRILFDKLGGTLVIRHDGHFGSETYHEHYPTLPILKTLILGETK